MKLQLMLASVIRTPVLVFALLVAACGHSLAGECPNPNPCGSYPGHYPCLCSFDELSKWDASSVDPRQIAKVPLAPRAVTSNPGMMIGLDFTGWNYAPQGDGAPQGGPVGNLYPFNHWQYVDIAYYYFHGLVSVPPVVWTDAAHRNGVKILGTVTADFHEVSGDHYGAKQFDGLFDTPEHTLTTQTKLEKMAQTFGFDGWIIDVEDTAGLTDHVIDTLAKLRKDGFSAVFYHDHVLSLPNEMSGSDILTAADAAGEWQSDYPGDPKATYDALSESPGKHLSRWDAYSAANIYAAEDMSASKTPRACPQGEITNTKACLNLSNTVDGQGTPLFPTLDSLIEGNPPGGTWTSVGVYAPGWPPYAGSNKFGDPLPPPSVWRPVDEVIWDGTPPTGQWCSTSSSGAISKYVAARSVISSLPFVTRFDRGIGTQYAVEGVSVASSQWNHFGAQDVLPMWFCRVEGFASDVDLSYQDGAAWEGGTTLRIHSNQPVSVENEWKLWSAAAKLSRPAVRVRYQGSGPRPFVRLSYEDGGLRKGAPNANTIKIDGDQDPGPNWTTTFVEIPLLEGKRLTGIDIGINASTTTQSADVQIGEIAIVDSARLEPPKLVKLGSSPELKWSTDTIKANVWAVNLNVGCVSFLGPAFTNSYDVSAALFPTGAVIDGYRVQPVSASGVPAVLDLPPCQASMVE